MNNLTPLELAQARHNAYSLFAQLFLSGVTEELVPYIGAVSELREMIPQPLVLDDAAAEHYRLFSLNLFPYESVFLDPAGILEGVVTDALAEAYQGMGFARPTNDVSADHIGHELAALAFLCGAEADAWADGMTMQANQIRGRQYGFLQTHVMRWWPALQWSIEAEDIPFYNRLVALTNGLLDGHFAELAAAFPKTEAPDGLPTPPDLLAEEKTGLKEIAEFLVTAPYSGMFLTRGMIESLARRHELPRGFGTRSQMMTNLFRSAVQYELLPAVLEDLSQVFAADMGNQMWAKRQDETRQLLQQIIDESDRVQDEGEEA